jgi:hypothetical protein
MKAAPYRSAFCALLCACVLFACAGSASATIPDRLDAPLAAPLLHASGQYHNTMLAQQQVPPPSRDNHRRPHYWTHPTGSTLNIRPLPSGASLDNPPPQNSHPPFARPTDSGLNVQISPSSPQATRVNEQNSPSPSQATRVNYPSPSQALKGRPGPAPAPRPASTGCGASGQCGEPNVGLITALAFRDFLYGIRGEDIICRSVAAMFAVTLPADGCTEETANAAKTVAFQVIVNDGGQKIYELVLKGNSSEMALSEGTWIERHRFYVTFGFDGRLEPHLTVFDFEPMFRTTAGLYPEREKQYEYIGRDRDSALREFQEKVKSAISSALEVAFKRQVGAR